MKHLRWSLAALGLLAGLAGSARANLVITVYEDHGATLVGSNTAPSGTTVTFTGDLGANFAPGWSITGTSNAGSGANALLELDYSKIVNASEGAGPVDLEIVLTDTGFLSPSGSPSTLSQTAQTKFTDKASTSVNTSWGNANNTENAKQTPTPPVTLTGLGSQTGSSSNPAFAHGTPFGLTNEVDLTVGTLGGSASGSLVTTVSGPSVNAVPEPASLALLGLGAFGAAGYAVRRRKAVG